MQDGHAHMDWKIVKEIYISHPFSLLQISPETSIKSNIVFATVNNSFEIHIYNSSMDPNDPERLNTVRTLRGHENYINSIAFSSDSQLIASGSDDHTCRIWEVKGSQDTLLTVLNFSSSITSVQFNSEESEKLIIGEKCGTIFVYCLKLNQSIYSFQTRHSPLFWLDWSSKNSQYVAVASGDQLLYFDITKSPVLLYSKRIHDIAKIVKISKNNVLVTASVGGKASNDLKVMHQKSQIPIIFEKLVACNGIAWHFSQPLLLVASDRKFAVYKVQVA